MSFFLLFILLLLIGVLLFVRGLRGVRTDDHPICRKCGFDLTGRPEGSDKCSECGADLTRPRAIRHGHRRRRPVALTFGLAMILLLIGLVGVIGWEQIRGFDPYQITPTWYLLREIRYEAGGAGVPVAAWQELNRRLGNGNLSKDHIARASDAALAIQGDRSKSWHTAVGDFIESARKRGDLAQEKWAGYARQAPTITVTLRPQVRRGDDDLPARIASGGARVGTNSHLRVRIDDPITALGDLLQPPPKRSGSGYTGFGLSAGGGGASTSRTFQLDPRATAADSALGAHEATVHVKVQMRDDGHDTTPPIVEWEEDFKAAWQLVPADTETLKLIDDDTFRQAVEQGTKIKYLGNGGSGSGQRDYFRLELQFRRIPVPLAHSVILRAADGREWKFTSITLGRGDIDYSTGGMIKGLDVGSVDLIFRPDPKAARGTVEVTELWNREFTIKNVPVQGPVSPLTPTTTKTTKTK